MRALQYRRLPLVFEAIRWDSNPETIKIIEEWLKASRQGGRVAGSTGIIYLTTAEGGTGCVPGDYLVRGLDGEVYPVVARRFEKLYEPEPAVPAEPTGPVWRCIACDYWASLSDNAVWHAANTGHGVEPDPGAEGAARGRLLPGVNPRSTS